MPRELPAHYVQKKVRFAVSNRKSDSYEIHFHSFYEIYYFVTGDADYLVEGNKYRLKPGSLILLSPNTLHGVRINSDADYVRCAVHFDRSFVSAELRPLLLSSFPGSKKNSPKEVFYENTDEYGLYELLKQLVAAQQQPEPICSQYYRIFLEALLAQISLMSKTLSPTTITSHVSAVITDIIRYLNEHLAEPLSLDFLSSHFFISKYYLNRAFRKATGTTVMDYVIYKRVVLARQLMLDGCTASDAALQAGFGDYTAFYRAYRKILKVSPGEDKRTM